MSAHPPPGVTKNNPFNLMYSPAISWAHQIRPASGGGLLEFPAPVDGLRAGMKDAHTKVYVHKYNTLNLFIPVFAPKAQNNTPKYIANMSEWLAIGPDDEIRIDTIERIVRWAKCINRQEVGFNPATGKAWYTDQQYTEAAHLALGILP